ncbi:MAG: ABC-2 transporter permease [Longibaculum sp.]
MKALIYKDLFILKQKGQLLSFLSLVITSVVIGYFFQNFYGLALIVVLSIPVGGSAFLQVVMEKEEKTNFEKAYLSLPVTKQEVVLARFITGFIYLFINMVIALVYMLFFVYYLDIVSLDVGLMLWGAGMAFGSILMALNSVGYHLLGSKKGTFVYLVFTGVSIAIYLIAFFGFDISSVLTIKPIYLLMIGVLIAIFCLLVSYIISLKILQRRYS